MRRGPAAERRGDPTPSGGGRTGRSIALGVAAGAAVAGAAVTYAARRSGISVAGWLVANVAVPLLGRKRPLLERIRENRRAGPALPPARLRRRLDIAEIELAGMRAFRLLPRGTMPDARLLYLHGGAYLFDLLAPHWTILAGLTERTRAEVVVPLYPLAPENKCAEVLPMIERAFDLIAADVGADRVIVGGDSAGGGMSLALAQALRDAGKAGPAALLLFSPWLDVTGSGPDQPALAARDKMLDLDQLREAGRMWAGDLDPADPRPSPLFGRHDGLPPMLVQVGTEDLLHSDALRLATAAPDVTLSEYPGMFHVWMAAPIPEGRRALDEAAAFVGAHVQPG